MKPLSPLPLPRWIAALAVLLAGTAGATTHTANSFAVTESGAATLSIPIQVPRGIGGMEPQLALNYSSQAGNGLLGLGWNLGHHALPQDCAATCSMARGLMYLPRLGPAVPSTLATRNIA